MPKKVLIALPPAMLLEVDFIAQSEHRTRSDMIRESLRRYIDGYRRQHGAIPVPQSNDPTRLSDEDYNELRIVERAVYSGPIVD